MQHAPLLEVTRYFQEFLFNKLYKPSFLFLSQFCGPQLQNLHWRTFAVIIVHGDGVGEEELRIVSRLREWLCPTVKLPS
jgi:hypothetical protein